MVGGSLASIAAIPLSNYLFNCIFLDILTPFAGRKGFLIFYSFVLQYLPMVFAGATAGIAMGCCSPRKPLYVFTVPTIIAATFYSLVTICSKYFNWMTAMLLSSNAVFCITGLYCSYLVLKWRSARGNPGQT